MSGTVDAVSKNEFLETRAWLRSHSEELPPRIGAVCSSIFDEYWSLLEVKKSSLENLKRLRESMGFIPKSEKGSPEKHLCAIG